MNGGGRVLTDQGTCQNLGIAGGGRYRVLAEEDTITALLHHGLPYEVCVGGNAAAAARSLAEGALERSIKRGLGYRLNGGNRQFDFCEVINFMVRAGRTGEDPWYETGPVQTFRRAFRELNHGDGYGRFEVLFRREYRLSSTGRRPVRLRVPLPREDPSLGGLNIAVIEPDPERVEVNLQAGRLEIRIDRQVVPREFVVVVRIEMNASTRSPVVDPARLEQWDRTDPEYQLYTQPREGLIRVTDRVARLAADLSARAKHACDVVRAFWVFFLERMWSGKIHHDELSRTDPLGSLLAGGWFDCLTGSSLFAALCRARGIPARVVNGCTFYPIIPSNHYWAEVLLPPFGWVPFDLASWDLAGGLDRSSSWEESYFGHVDPRMIFQRFPRQILGPPGVPFPASWYSLPAVRDRGLETSYIALDTGELLYCDWTRVRRLDDHTGQTSSLAQSRGCRTVQDALDPRSETSADVRP